MVVKKPYHWRAEKHGVIVRAELDVYGREQPLTALFGLEPYQFYAVPRFRSNDEISVPIDCGYEPIWLFGTNHAIEVFGHGETTTTALFFGRRNIETKREEVALVLADGTAAVFNSVDEAMAAFFEGIASAQRRR